MEKGLNRIPWHAYLPLDDFKSFKMPQTRVKTHKSKITSTRVTRDALTQYINETPFRREFKNNIHEFNGSYKKFKQHVLTEQSRDNRHKIAITKGSDPEIEDTRPGEEKKPVGKKPMLRDYDKLKEYLSEERKQSKQLK